MYDTGNYTSICMKAITVTGAIPIPSLMLLDVVAPLPRDAVNSGLRLTEIQNVRGHSHANLIYGREPKHPVHQVRRLSICSAGASTLLPHALTQARNLKLSVMPTAPGSPLQQAPRMRRHCVLRSGPHSLDGLVFYREPKNRSFRISAGVRTR